MKTLTIDEFFSKIKKDSNWTSKRFHTGKPGEWGYFPEYTSDILIIKNKKFKRAHDEGREITYETTQHNEKVWGMFNSAGLRDAVITENENGLIKIQWKDPMDIHKGSFICEELMEIK